MGLDLLRLTLETEDSPVAVPDDVYSAASIIESARYRWCVDNIGPMEAEVIERFSRPWVRFQLGLKRLFDIVGSFVLIVLLSPSCC